MNHQSALLSSRRVSDTVMSWSDTLIIDIPLYEAASLLSEIVRPTPGTAERLLIPHLSDAHCDDYAEDLRNEIISRLGDDLVKPKGHISMWQIVNAKMDKYPSLAQFYIRDSAVRHGLDSSVRLMLSTWRMEDTIEMDEVIIGGLILSSWVAEEHLTVSRVAAVLSKIRRQFFSSLYSTTLISHPIMLLEQLIPQGMPSETWWEGDEVNHLMNLMTTHTEETNHLNGSCDTSIVWLWMMLFLTDVSSFTTGGFYDNITTRANLLRQIGIDNVAPYLAGITQDPLVIAGAIAHEIDSDIIAAL